MHAVDWLIATGAEVHWEDGITALYAAASRGHADMVSRLIVGGADVTQDRTDHRGTPLDAAAVNRHVMWWGRGASDRGLGGGTSKQRA